MTYLRQLWGECNNVHEISLKKGILVDKNVHKNSWNVSKKIHLVFCHQKFAFYVHENSAIHFRDFSPFLEKNFSLLIYWFLKFFDPPCLFQLHTMYSLPSQKSHPPHLFFPVRLLIQKLLHTSSVIREMRVVHFLMNHLSILNNLVMSSLMTRSSLQWILINLTLLI